MTDEIAEKIANWQGITKIYYSDLADSLIATAIFIRTFVEMKKPCVASLYSEEELINNISNNENVLFIILGTLPNYSSLVSSNLHIYILNNDPHKREKSENTIIIHPEFTGYTGNEFTISSLSYLICSSLITNLDYIVKLPLIAFHTLVSGIEYTGISQYIAQDAIDGGIINQIKQLRILGASLFSVHEALLNSNNPFLPGLTGNSVGVDKVLARAGVEIETSESKRKLKDFAKEEIASLNNSIILHLSSQNVEDDDDLIFIKVNSIFLDESEYSITGNVWDFAASIVDSINRKEYSLALKVLIGNRGSELLKLQRLFVEERRAISASYQLIMDKQKNIEELSYLRYLNTDRKTNWYNACIVSAMALSNGLVTSDVPFAIVTPGPSNYYTIGLRSPAEITDLANGMYEIVDGLLKENKITTKLIGTKLTAQFYIEKDLVEDFLIQISNKLGEQINEVQDQSTN